VRPYNAQDVRFTAKGNTVYAFLMAWPDGGKATLKSLAAGSAHYTGEVGRVELLGASGALPFTRTPEGLVVTLPNQKPNDFAYALKITAKT
jgi:alpha-L-fucosidase